MKRILEAGTLPRRRLRTLLLVMLVFAGAGCEAFGRELFGTYGGPDPQTNDLVDEVAIVRSVIRDPAGEREGLVSLIHLDRLQYLQPGRRGDVNRVVALLHTEGGMSLDSLGLEVGDTVTVTTSYLGVTLSGPGPGQIPDWAGYDYLEYPIAGHRLLTISR
jgi:hypothetical protein